MSGVDEMDTNQVEVQYITMNNYLTNHKKHGRKDKTFNRAVINHISTLTDYSNSEIKEGIKKAADKTARIEIWNPKAVSKMMDRSTTSNCNSKTIDNVRSLDNKTETPYHRSSICESSTYKRYDQAFGDAAVELLHGEYPNPYSIVLDCNNVLDMILSAPKMMEHFGKTRDQILAGDLPPKIFLIISLDGAKTFSNEGHNLCTMRLVDTGGFISSILAPNKKSKKKKAGEDVSGATSTTTKNKCHSVRIQYPIGLSFGKDDYESSKALVCLS